MMRIRAVAFTLLVCCSLFYASTNVGVIWDEPIYLHSARQIQQFIIQGDYTDRAASQRLNGFQWADVHPFFAKASGTITLSLFERWFGELLSYRLANIILVSMAGGLIYFAISRRFRSEMIGLITALSCITMPRVAGQAMLGDTDSTLYAMSLPAVLSGYLGARDESPVWSALCAVFCGICMATKFTGAVVPIGIFVWTFLYYRKSGSFNFFFIAVIAPLVFVLLNPYYWHDPIVRSLDFFIRSSSRHLTERHYGYLFGQLFTTTPWYYPLVYLFATVPPLVLILGSVGLIINAKHRFSDPLGGLFGLMALLPALLVLLPKSPAFGGARLFLMSFLYFGLFSAWALHRWMPLFRRKIILFGILVATILPVLLCQPFGLEYYAPQIGGLKGASRLELEITYWWDAANPEFYSIANQILPEDAKVALFPADDPLRKYYARHRLLNGTIVPFEDSHYMIVLCYHSYNDKRLIRYVRQIYPSFKILLRYPDDIVPFVVLIKKET